MLCMHVRYTPLQGETLHVAKQVNKRWFAPHHFRRVTAMASEFFKSRTDFCRLFCHAQTCCVSCNELSLTSMHPLLFILKVPRRVFSMNATFVSVVTVIS